MSSSPKVPTPRAQDRVRLADGQLMAVARLPEIDDNTWAEVKRWLEANTDIANGIRSFSRNPSLLRNWLQTEAVAQFYHDKLRGIGGEDELKEQLATLESDEGLKQVFDDIRDGGLDAVFKYWEDEDLLLKIGEKWGVAPRDMLKQLTAKEDNPLTFHEAAALGKHMDVAGYMKSSDSVDAQDLKGITPLGHAIGAGQHMLVGHLLNAKANPHAVDANGNNALHYAAGYGQKECMEILAKTSAVVNQVNRHGQTPLTVATMNRHQECIDQLMQRGAHP